MTPSLFRKVVYGKLEFGFGDQITYWKGTSRR